MFNFGTAIKFTLSLDQQQAFNNHFRLLQDEYEGLFGEDTIASVRRLATSTFRMAMILTALRIMDDGNAASPRVCSDADYDVAMSISEVLQQHMLRVINELPATPTRMVVGKAKEPLLLQTFWDNLPDEFEAKDFKEIAGSIGLTIPTAERYIRAWTGTRLEKVVRGRYRKEVRSKQNESIIQFP